METLTRSQLLDLLYDSAEEEKVKRKPFTILVDEDIIEYFKSFGKGYGKKINRLLRVYVDHVNK